VHAISGAEAQLLAQAILCGLTDAGIELDSGSSFWFTTETLATEELEYGESGPLTCDYGEQIPPAGYWAKYGVQTSDDIAHNLQRLIAYFKPARERWNGIKIVT
jgi:hypothetical protein